MFNQINFQDLYNQHNNKIFSKQEDIARSSYESKRNLYYHGKGFHIYTQLSLTLQYTAPQNKTDAEKAFEIIQRYTDIIDICSQEIKGRILEIQGEIIHIFIETDISPKTAFEVYAFCHEITNAIYAQKKKLGNIQFQGFETSLDFGESIIISTGNDLNDSFVSLGPSANAPAKHLSDVSAGQVGIPTAIADLIFPDLDHREKMAEYQCAAPQYSYQYTKH